jgi:hypothetical protein
MAMLEIINYGQVQIINPPSARELIVLPNTASGQ